MKKNLLKVACAAMALAVGVTSAAACGSSEEAYFIGASGPLTGGAASYGIAVQNGASMAIEEINAAGGLDGVNLKFEMLDDAHDSTKVPNNFSNLLEKGMQVSLGCVTTVPCLEFKNYARENEVFFLTPSATGTDVPDGEHGAFQMCFTDPAQGTKAAEYVKANASDKKIGVLYKSDDDYSKGIHDAFMAEFTDAEKANIKTASFIESTDFSSQIAQLKDCNFIFLPVYTEPASKFMVQAKDKVATDAIYFGCDGLDGVDKVEGFDINSIPQEVSYLSHFNANATTGKAGEFVRKYTEKYGTDTLNQFGASAYDCVYALFDAMKAAKDAGKNVSPSTSAADFCKILIEEFTTDGFTFSGATGTNVKWNKDGTVSKTPEKNIVKAATNA